MLCFNTTAMRDMLGMCGDKDTVKITYNAATNPDHLILGFASKLRYSHAFLRLADATDEPMHVPQMHYGRQRYHSHCTPPAVNSR